MTGTSGVGEICVRKQCSVGAGSGRAVGHGYLDGVTAREFVQNRRGSCEEMIGGPSVGVGIGRLGWG